MAFENYSPEKRRVMELSHAHLIPGRIDTFEKIGASLVMGKREGYFIHDLGGHRLIDLHLNGGTFNLGHRNPVLIGALARALEQYDIGNHHFPSAPRAGLAKTLAESAPGAMKYVVYASGGSEAVDIAIKSARRATGRRKIVSIGQGYHGRSGLSGAAGDDADAAFFLSDRPDEFTKVPWNDLAAMEEALANEDVAGVILETIPATMGFPLPAEGYLSAVKSLCEKHGALYIADEVQTGLARTGSLWGVERFGVEPDILVTGKGLSGGLYPIAAAVLSERAGDWLREKGWGHVSTFGGAEAGCVLAQKVMEISADPATTENVARISERMGGGLAEIASRRPFLKEVRQAGLVMGLVFDNDIGALLMNKALYEEGIWAMFAGFDLSVLQWKPGVLVDEPLCDEILERFDKALSRF